MNMVRKGLIGFITCLAVVATGTVLAGDREQAKRIHDRLVGTPPSADCLDQLQTQIAANNEIDAALDAITNNGAGDDCTGQDFYRVTLKNFITPWTNEEQTIFAPLNDYTATVIGIIRDEYDFRRILSDNIIYTGNGVLPAYAPNSNAHYETMTNQNTDLQAVLVEGNQTDAGTLNLPASAAAGIMSTRQGARAFYVDGTNRAMFRFTVLNHLCTDLEQIKDTSRSPDRVRQDVSRSPGGDSRIYMNACVGCHAGMDPLSQAYAYYDYEYPPDDGDADDVPEYDEGQLVYNTGNDDHPGCTVAPATDCGTRVQYKNHINANNFEYGYRTPDDQWDNYWRVGTNSALGWGWAPASTWTVNPNSSGSGNGAASLGQELADSYAFARCQVQKVFKSVCLRSPVDQNDRDQVDAMIASFRDTGGASGDTNFNLKQVFAESALYCMGD